MSVTFTEQPHDFEWLLSEANGYQSRSEVTVTRALNTPILSGTVLGRITATGKYVARDSAATNGSEISAAILLHAIPAGAAGDVRAAVIDGHAEVRQADGVAAYVAAELSALNIKIRTTL